MTTSAVMPEVSVIVPNFNHARYLPRRIESILGQTFDDFELLFLDDASPDDSRDVAQRFASDRRVRFAFNEVNSGSPYLQWRKGISLTKGRLIWIAESDDYAAPEFLERLVPLLRENPRVGLAVCDSYLVDSQDAVLGKHFDFWRDDQMSKYDLSVFDRPLLMDGREYARSLMCPWNTIPNASGVLFRREALDGEGVPDVSMKLCGDWLTYCRILSRFDIARIPDHLNYFRQHTQNVRTRTKVVDFIGEALTVERYVEQEFSGVASWSRSSSRAFYSRVLLGSERQAPFNKVPLARFPAVLGRAAAFGPSILGRAAQMLLKESCLHALQPILRHWRSHRA
jgi:glycosyltransferase involved in cell wall biosynthesis